MWARSPQQEYNEAILNFLVIKLGARCGICGRYIKTVPIRLGSRVYLPPELSIEYITSLYEGGANELSNMRIVHRRISDCNGRKGLRKKGKGLVAQSHKEAVINYLCDRDGLICQICKQKVVFYEDASIDHLNPVSKGGENRLDNFRLVHLRCNHFSGRRGGVRNAGSKIETQA